MTPGRRLIYDFMNLPHYKQLQLLTGFYTQEEFQELDDVELFGVAFRHAKEQGKLDDLRAAIRATSDEIKEWRAA